MKNEMEPRPFLLDYKIKVGRNGIKGKYSISTKPAF